ncbi:unnamed protein product, partial [Allacma fusca]
DVKTSCTIKLTNSLDFVLSDPQYHFWFGSKNSGPPKVDGSFSEVFHFKGDSISYVSTDQTLNDKLLEISPAPDVWFPKKHSEVPLERFVTHGNLLLRGHMSNGPRSIFSCVVEIVNCLSVPLSSPNNWYCNSEENNRLPLEILALHRESFFASGETNFEAMFSYEIISSDLALVIALKVGSGGKSFAAAFVPIPAVTEKKELDALMGKNQWKTHEYKTNANANEGMQCLQMSSIESSRKFKSTSYFEVKMDRN